MDFNQYRSSSRVIAVALLLLFGLAFAQAQDNNYQQPLKPGAWLVKNVSELDGRRTKSDPSTLPLKFHEEQLAKGFVHEDGGRILMCRTREQLNVKQAIQQTPAGCETVIVESTPQRSVTRTKCEKYKSAGEAVITYHNSENYTVMVDTDLEIQGKQSHSKTVMAGTWLGSDCKSILEERFAVVRANVQRREAMDAEKAEREREQAAADSEPESTSDASVVVKGLLEGLQQYADAKKLRKESQSQPRVALPPVQTYTQPVRQPLTIVDTPPTISVGSLPGEPGGQGQCSSTGNTTADKKAHDLCRCNSYPTGKTVFQDQGSKGWACTQLRPSKLFLFGCSIGSNGRLNCTQV